MVVSFSWHNYSVAFSFLKKGAGVGRVQQMLGSDRARKVSEHDLFEAADRIKTELVSGIRAQAIKKPEKLELLFYLRELLIPHTVLRIPQAYAFRIAINNVIERNAEEYCSIRLTRQDLSLLWQEAG
ncbi:MAG TPA: hypothetical protein VL832_05640 [Puia sp.]|nr:hypothetical protein [Puia sp.]